MWVIIYFTCVSGVLIRYLLKESWEIKQTLNFDYTKSSLIGIVPILLCVSIDYGVKRMEKINVGKNVGSKVISLD